MTETKYITATARQAGAKIHHVVFGFDGQPIGERRSERRYAYAICKRYRGAHVEVVRWSGSARTAGWEFAVEVKDA